MDEKWTMISNLGTNETRIITSPGFGMKYPKNHLVRYNIQCKADEVAHFSVASFELQTNRCPGDRSCRDYIQIYSPAFASTEKMCGDVPPALASWQLRLRTFTVVFRTGSWKEFKGFQMFITCMRTADIQPPDFARRRRSTRQNAEPLSDCIHVSEFTSGACTKGKRGTMQHPLPSSRRRKSCGEIASFYSKLFPGRGYPPDLRISPDLATFVSLPCSIDA
jgi:hypothetical protein